MQSFNVGLHLDLYSLMKQNPVGYNYKYTNFNDMEKRQTDRISKLEKEKKGNLI